MKTIKKIEVERLDITSNKPFEVAVSALEGLVDRPNMQQYMKDISATKTWAEAQPLFQKAVSETGFMIFMTLDPGAIIRLESGIPAPKLIRFIIGNALIMKEMAKHVPHAAAYAPVTILVSEQPDGVHFYYDKMVSLLAPYGSEKALEVARDLDLKVENILIKAAI